MTLRWTLSPHWILLLACSYACVVNGLVPQQQITSLSTNRASFSRLQQHQRLQPVTLLRQSAATTTTNSERSPSVPSSYEVSSTVDKVDEPIVTAATMSEEETASISSSSAVTTKKLTYLDDGFVFGLEGSGLERPKGRNPSIVLDGDSLETQPYQVAMVTATFLAHAFFFYHSFVGMLDMNHGDVLWTSLQAMLLVLSSWVLADFGSGVLHWSVDNYGNGRTFIFGSLIAAFQGHHSAPWTITERGFCNNVYKLCIPFGIVPMTLINWIATPSITFFFTSFCVMEILSQEFHKWSHMTKGQCPPWANWLQDVGVAVGRVPHAQHHLAPYHGNYCIISGICNKALDESGLFRRMERIIYQWNGVESNAWKLDATLRERTLQGDYEFRQN